MTMLVPKLIGSDNEVGNIMVGKPAAEPAVVTPAWSGYSGSGYSGSGYSSGTDSEASSLLKKQFRGVDEAPPLQKKKKRKRKYIHSEEDWNDGYGSDHGGHYSFRDWGRKWLSNGGCAYIDSNHLEVCTPIVRSAYDYAAALHAMLRLTRASVASANESLTPPDKVCAFLANSDGHGNSWGSHIDMLVSREAWDNLFLNKLHYALYLASYQVSSIVFTGQGKVGAENKRPPIGFQLSQRADFFECMMGIQTTYDRPILNTRDETLCGSSEDLARLHIIFYDWNLCHVANVLKVGVLQIMLAMIEARIIDPNLILDDPLKAVTDYSRDATLKVTARTAGGMDLTAVEMQLRFLEAAKKFVEAGHCEGIVPNAMEIVSLWEDTLLKLRDGDWKSLMGRLDWVLKQQVIARACKGFESPEAKRLDFLYSDLSDGLYWAYENSGLVQRLVSPETVSQFAVSAPHDTRAWLRGEILKRAPDMVSDVDWDKIVLKVPDGKGSWDRKVVKMPVPYKFTRAELEGAIASAGGIVEALAAMKLLDDDVSYSSGYGYGSGSEYWRGGHGAHQSHVHGHQGGAEWEYDKGSSGDGAWSSE
jgi:proteasome accessory factor A